MKLRANKEGDQYKLYGEKTWCTFANRAHVLTVLARTNPDVQPPHKGLSILLVEKDAGRRLPSAGARRRRRSRPSATRA